MTTSDGRDQLNAWRLHALRRQVSEDGPAEGETGCAAGVWTVRRWCLHTWKQVSDFYTKRLDANNNSWWLFPEHSRVRVACLRVTGNRWFKRFIILLVLGACVVMAIDDPGCTDACKQEALLSQVVSAQCNRCNMYNKVSTVLDVFFLACFTLEILMRSIANNLVLGPGAYLKSGWNWIDFLATASGYLRYLPLGDDSNLSGVRAMRALRPLRALNAIPGLRLLVETLLEALPLLMDVIFLLAWVFFVFGIVALNLFMGKLHSRCLVLEPVNATSSSPSPLPPNTSYDSPQSPPVPLPPSLPAPGPWGALANVSVNGSEYSGNGTLMWQFLPGYENSPCATSGPGLFMCPEGSYCMDINTNPNYGYTSFDNFGAASYCIFQMLTLDAWTTTLLYPLMNSIGPYIPIPYFSLLVIFGAFFAMQLLVAVLSSKFAQLSAMRPKKKKRRRRRRICTPPDTTDEEDDGDEGGISDGEGAAIAAPRRRRRRKPIWTVIRRWCRRFWYRFNKRYLLALRRKELPPWRAFFWDLSYSLGFNNFMTACILANTATLGMEYYGMSSTYVLVLQVVNLILTACFMMEFLVRHIGIGVVGYWRYPWNILDGSIVLLSVAELVLEYGPSGGGGSNTQSLRTFRMLRILRSLKLLARIEGLRKLMHMVLKGFVALKDFMLLLILFIFIFSILGLQQFGGSPYFAPLPNDVGYTSSFDTLWQSAYTVFQLLTADNWVATSWSGMQARGVAAALYFVAWIIIGNFILLTLFLAILISNFQRYADRPPSDEELKANPFGPEDQSETASTLGGTLGGDDDGALGGRNALQERLQRRADPDTVYRIKKWMVLMNYYHGLNKEEKDEIESRLDAFYQMDPEVFQPDANPSIMDMDDRQEARDNNGGGPTSTAAQAARAGLQRANRSLRMTLTRIGGAHFHLGSLPGLLGHRTSADGTAPESGAGGATAAAAAAAAAAADRASVPAGRSRPATHWGMLNGAKGKSLKRLFGVGAGADTADTRRAGNRDSLERRSAPQASPSGRVPADVDPTVDKVAVEDEPMGFGRQVDRDVLLTSHETGDSTRGRMLNRHRSAVVRRGGTLSTNPPAAAEAAATGRPKLMTVRSQKISLPPGVAAAIAAMRASVPWQPPDENTSTEGGPNDKPKGARRKEVAAVTGAAAPGCGSPEGIEGEDEGDGTEGDGISPTPSKRRAAFVEHWRSWFDDAETAQATGRMPSILPSRPPSLDHGTSAVDLPQETQSGWRWSKPTAAAVATAAAATAVRWRQTRPAEDARGVAARAAPRESSSPPADGAKAAEDPTDGETGLRTNTLPAAAVHGAALAACTAAAPGAAPTPPRFGASANTDAPLTPDGGDQAPRCPQREHLLQRARLIGREGSISSQCSSKGRSSGSDDASGYCPGGGAARLAGWPGRVHRPGPGVRRPGEGPGTSRTVEASAARRLSGGSAADRFSEGGPTAVRAGTASKEVHGELPSPQHKHPSGLPPVAPRRRSDASPHAPGPAPREPVAGWPPVSPADRLAAATRQDYPQRSIPSAALPDDVSGGGAGVNTAVPSAPDRTRTTHPPQVVQLEQQQQQQQQQQVQPYVDSRPRTPQPKAWSLPPSLPNTPNDLPTDASVTTDSTQPAPPADSPLVAFELWRGQSAEQQRPQPRTAAGAAALPASSALQQQQQPLPPIQSPAMSLPPLPPHPPHPPLPPGQPASIRAAASALAAPASFQLFDSFGSTYRSSSSGDASGGLPCALGHEGRSGSGGLASPDPHGRGPQPHPYITHSSVGGSVSVSGSATGSAAREAEGPPARDAITAAALAAAAGPPPGFPPHGGRVSWTGSAVSAVGSHISGPLPDAGDAVRSQDRLPHGANAGGGAVAIPVATSSFRFRDQSGNHQGTPQLRGLHQPSLSPLYSVAAMQQPQPQQHHWPRKPGQSGALHRSSTMQEVLGGAGDEAVTLGSWRASSSYGAANGVEASAHQYPPGGMGADVMASGPISWLTDSSDSSSGVPEGDEDGRWGVDEESRRRSAADGRAGGDGGGRAGVGDRTGTRRSQLSRLAAFRPHSGSRLASVQFASAAQAGRSSSAVTASTDAGATPQQGLGACGTSVGSAPSPRSAGEGAARRVHAGSETALGFGSGEHAESAGSLAMPTMRSLREANNGCEGSWLPLAAAAELPCGRRDYFGAGAGGRASSTVVGSRHEAPSEVAYDAQMHEACKEYGSGASAEEARNLSCVADTQPPMSAGLVGPSVSAAAAPSAFAFSRGTSPASLAPLQPTSSPGPQIPSLMRPPPPPVQQTLEQRNGGQAPRHQAAASPHSSPSLQPGDTSPLRHGAAPRSGIPLPPIPMGGGATGIGQPLGRISFAFPVSPAAKTGGGVATGETVKTSVTPGGPSRMAEAGYGQQLATAKLRAADPKTPGSPAGPISRIPKPPLLQKLGDNASTSSSANVPGSQQHPTVSPARITNPRRGGTAAGSQVAPLTLSTLPKSPVTLRMQGSRSIPTAPSLAAPRSDSQEQRPVVSATAQRPVAPMAAPLEASPRTFSRIPSPGTAAAAVLALRGVEPIAFGCQSAGAGEMDGVGHDGASSAADKSVQAVSSRSSSQASSSWLPLPPAAPAPALSCVPGSSLQDGMRTSGATFAEAGASTAQASAAAPSTACPTSPPAQRKRFGWGAIRKRPAGPVAESTWLQLCTDSSSATTPASSAASVRWCRADGPSDEDASVASLWWEPACSRSAAFLQLQHYSSLHAGLRAVEPQALAANINSRVFHSLPAGGGLPSHFIAASNGLRHRISHALSCTGDAGAAAAVMESRRSFVDDDGAPVVELHLDSELDTSARGTPETPLPGDDTDSRRRLPEAEVRLTLAAEESSEMVDGGRKVLDQNPVRLPKARISRANEDPVYLSYSSFFFLRPHHPLRLMLQSLVTNVVFEGMVTFMILVACVVLALDRPRNSPDGNLAAALRVMNLVINMFFGLEMCIKMLLKGFVGHPSAYWRTPWDILDGTIAITSLLSMIESVGFFRTLRLLRVLRPLRMMSRVRGMQVVVETLIKSLPAVAETVMFGGFLFTIFGILGTQLFMGRLSRCNQSYLPNGEAIQNRSQCTSIEFVCTDADICNTGDVTVRAWVTPFRNFDHIGRSLLTLFIVASLDGYMDTLQAVVDAVGVDQQPVYNHAPWMGLYIIAFVFLGAFFWLNLLVSAIIDYYNRLAIKEGTIMQSKETRDFMKLLQFQARQQKDYWRKIPKPNNKLRAKCYSWASSPYFDNFIMAVILANVLVMALPHEGSSEEFNNVLSYLNAGLTFVFVFEMVVKMMAMGPKLYIQDHWNKLDLFIIATSIPDMLSLLIPLGAGTGVITVFRIMRIGRMFKLIRNAKGLRTLFNTLISSLPVIFKVGSLLFLLMFIYAVLGMNLFGGYGSPFDDSDSRVSFDNFGSSLIALFQVFTVDGWSAVMATAAGCDNLEFQCDSGGQSVVACLFFSSFIMLATFIMLNLVIAAILDNFISNAESEGLLRPSNFTDVMKSVIALRVFVLMLRKKIDAMKVMEELRAAAAAAAGLTGVGASSGRERWTKLRRKGSSLAALALPGSSHKGGDPSPGGGGPYSPLYGDGLASRALSQHRSSYQSIISRLLPDPGPGDIRETAKSHHSFGGGGGFTLASLRRTFTRQGSCSSVAGAISLSGPLPAGATALAQVRGPLMSGPGAYDLDRSRTMSGRSLWPASPHDGTDQVEDAAGGAGGSAAGGPGCVHGPPPPDGGGGGFLTGGLASSGLSFLRHRRRNSSGGGGVCGGGDDDSRDGGVGTAGSASNRLLGGLASMFGASMSLGDTRTSR